MTRSETPRTPSPCDSWSDARPLGAGVAWYEGEEESAVYDIIGGSAGIGLTLLYLHETRSQPGALDLAVEAGRLLASRGRPEHDGLKWPMSEAYPRLMPNFSHGTAGVAYFLARLHGLTAEVSFWRQPFTEHGIWRISPSAIPRMDA